MSPLSPFSISRTRRAGVAVAIALVSAGCLADGAGAAASPMKTPAVARVLLRHYSILSSDRVAAKTVPSFFDHSLRRAGKRLGLDLGAVAEARPSAGVRMWLIPGTVGYCGYIVNANGSGGGACGLIRGNAFGPGTISTGKIGITDQGFVPDGIRQVTVHLTSGHSFTVPVKDNTFVAHISRGSFASITAVNAAGKVLTRVGG